MNVINLYKTKKNFFFIRNLNKKNSNNLKKMEGSHIKNIDFQNISGQSLGEVDPDARLKAIEKKVKETFAFTKKYKEKGKRLPFDKLLPFLNNINAVSQHNYKYFFFFQYFSL